MKRVLAFLKATLLDGVIFGLPAWLTVLSVMQCISKWGGGSDKLLVAYDAARSHASPLVTPTNQQQITNKSV